MTEREIEFRLRLETIKQLIKDFVLDFADLSSNLNGEKREACLTLAHKIYSETDKEIIEHWREKTKQSNGKKKKTLTSKDLGDLIHRK